MTDIYFRPTAIPEQEKFLDGFTTSTYDNVNRIIKMMMAPFFGLYIHQKLHPIVCPGGYRGEECFKASSDKSIITIGPGFSIINEVLLEAKNTIIIDIDRSSSYFDSKLSNVYTKVYVLIYYYPYITGQSGYSGASGISGYNNRSPLNFYIGISTYKNTYLYNRDRYCFLYCLDIEFTGNTISNITNIRYIDPDDSRMCRYVPNN